MNVIAPLMVTALANPNDTVCVFDTLSESKGDLAAQLRAPRAL